jgi:type IV pilus assembly protein PilP
MHTTSSRAKIMRATFLAAAIASMAACTKPMSQLDTYIKEVQDRPPPALEPPPALKQFPIFVYQADLLRDPFDSGDKLGEDGNGEVAQELNDPDCPDLTRVREQLEGFAVDSLDMVGTMSQGKDYFGLLKDPEGVIHRVKVGDFAGQNYGQITSVTDSQIDMEERVKDDTGGCERRNQAITLVDNNN